MKICKKCGSVFEGARCKPCERKRGAKYRAENGERIRINQERWRLENIDQVRAVGRKGAARRYAENPKKEIAKVIAYQTRNKEEVRKSNARWRAENPEKVREQKRKWHADNPDGRRIHERNRQARKRKNGGSLSNGIASKLLKMQRGQCVCCHVSIKNGYHLDHIMPLVLGGANTDDNVQLLCPTCNCQKRSKHPIDFMQSRGFLV